MCESVQMIEVFCMSSYSEITVGRNIK